MATAKNVMCLIPGLWPFLSLPVLTMSVQVPSRYSGFFPKTCKISDSEVAFAPALFSLVELNLEFIWVSVNTGLEFQGGPINRSRVRLGLLSSLERFTAGVNPIRTNHRVG